MVNLSCITFIIPSPVSFSNVSFNQKPISSNQQLRQQRRKTTTKINNSPSSRTIPSASLSSTTNLNDIRDQLTYTTINPFTHTNEKEKRRKPTHSPSQTIQNPIVIIPGYGASASVYKDLRDDLKTVLCCDDKYVRVAPITLREWAMTVGGRPMTAVLQVIDDAVRQAILDTNADKATIVGHSAGGWIARVYLGEVPYHGAVWNGKRFVNQLVCLGTPHDSGEPVTKNNMSFVNFHYPHAHFQTDDHDNNADADVDAVQYLNFAGDGVQVFKNQQPLWWQFWHPQWMAKLSYQLTDPYPPTERNTNTENDDVLEGDGIVPLSVTFLKGAYVNCRLQGVWHAVDSKGPWYGDEAVVRYWSQFLK